MESLIICVVFQAGERALALQERLWRADQMLKAAGSFQQVRPSSEKTEDFALKIVAFLSRSDNFLLKDDDSPLKVS